LFAGTVCLFHASRLSGEREWRWISAVLSSEVAVETFFVVSVLLILMSYERSSSIFAY
jgi:peptidoglycan/LPS O-acetylase OafA/YrhL